jgi:hypothetical protein
MANPPCGLCRRPGAGPVCSDCQKDLNKRTDKLANDANKGGGKRK